MSSIMKDKGLDELEKILMNYITENGYKVKTEPFSTNMRINENDVLESRGEFIVMATFYNNKNELKSCKIIPSLNELYEGDRLIKKIE